MRRTAGYTWTDYKTYRDCRRIKYNPVLDKIQDYKRNWTEHVNRMPCNITHADKKLHLKRQRNQGRPLKRLLEAWDQNGSTSGPTPWPLHGYNCQSHTWHYMFWLLLLAIIRCVKYTHIIKMEPTAIPYDPRYKNYTCGGSTFIFCHVN
jgi:hypothetical protein